MLAWTMCISQLYALFTSKIRGYVLVARCDIRFFYDAFNKEKREAQVIPSKGISPSQGQYTLRSAALRFT